ncbi:hypothetical protein I79_020040 [Cricetulus griseus]|uniref:Uncharacterized protein n=1 Tax=Cricetulus griseus TaxID=10029 RepID=G3I907_CRIGR|nr:hypothetical protein I79_020040 [Cricetulus griseus]
MEDQDGTMVDGVVTSGLACSYFLTEKLQLWNLAGGWRGRKECQVTRTIKDHSPTHPTPPHRGPQESQ